MRPNIVVFASGSQEGGGSGARKLADNRKEFHPNGMLNANIVAMVSNHANGGVARHAAETGIPFIHFPKPWDADHYRAIVQEIVDLSFDTYQAGLNLIALSGWLKFFAGIKNIPVINIHPGRLPDTAGLHGHQVHEYAIERYGADSTYRTAISMHFVPYQEKVDPADYDTGPVFFEYPIAIQATDTAESLAATVNGWEHNLQSWVTDMVAHKTIQLSGSGQLILPPGYAYLPQSAK